MYETNNDREQLQLELPLSVLCRLLRERKLVASEIRYLNDQSSKAGWWAIKNSVMD